MLGELLASTWFKVCRVPRVGCRSQRVVRALAAISEHISILILGIILTESSADVEGRVALTDESKTKREEVSGVLPSVVLRLSSRTRDFHSRRWQQSLVLT